MRSRILPVLAALTALSFPALAQDAPKPAPLPPGGTILNIGATERVQVPQDLLIAELRAEKTGPDAKAVQNDINTMMKTAADKAKAVAGVKVSTGGYYVYEETPPVTKENPTPKKSWRASQTIEIKGTTAEDILKLSGDLQSLGLVMNGLNYSISPEKADEAKDALMETALAKLKARAERAAKAVGKTQTEIIEINVDASDNNPGPIRPMMMAMASGVSAKMATPTAEPGETEITLTVTAKAVLKP